MKPIKMCGCVSSLMSWHAARAKATCIYIHERPLAVLQSSTKMSGTKRSGLQRLLTEGGEIRLKFTTVFSMPD